MRVMAGSTESDRPDATSGLARCSRCAAVGYANDRFCPACGAPMLHRCIACGATVVHLIAAFCTHCGARLGARKLDG